MTDKKKTNVIEWLITVGDGNFVEKWEYELLNNLNFSFLQTSDRTRAARMSESEALILIDDIVKYDGRTDLGMELAEQGNVVFDTTETHWTDFYVLTQDHNWVAVNDGHAILATVDNEEDAKRLTLAEALNLIKNNAFAMGMYEANDAVQPITKSVD